MSQVAESSLSPHFHLLFATNENSLLLVIISVNVWNSHCTQQALWSTLLYVDCILDILVTSVATLRKFCLTCSMANRRKLHFLQLYWLYRINGLRLMLIHTWPPSLAFLVSLLSNVWSAGSLCLLDWLYLMIVRSLCYLCTPNWLIPSLFSLLPCDIKGIISSSDMAC